MSNLEELYFKAFKNCIVFDYIEDDDVDRLVKKIDSLCLTDTDRITFIDHFPTISNFFRAIDNLNLINKPSIYIHTFGDFNIRVNEYFGIQEILKKYNISLIAPSTRAKKHLETLIDNKMKVFPFPIKVSQEAYSFKRNLPAFEKLIVSIGRVSYQKRSLDTLKIVSNYLEKNKNCIYVIAGSIDNHGIPLYGKHDGCSFEKEFKSYLENLNTEIKDRIIYLEEISKDQVEALLDLADLYISLSTYHTEDFGMAPLEAKIKGVRCLLSDWGGYSDFAQGEFCQLVPVKLTTDGLTIDKKEVLNKMMEMLQMKYSEKDKEQNIKLVLNKYGQDSLVDKLVSMYNEQVKPFAGFTNYAKVFYWINKKGMRFDLHPGTLYEELFKGFYE